MAGRPKLYWHPLSGHSHRALLFAALIGVELELVEIDLSQGAHKTPAFRTLNAFGQVPVLLEGDTAIADSNAILVYLAKSRDARDWLPEDAVGAARVQRWLSVAAGEIAAGPAAARLVTVFGAPFDADAVIKRAHAILSLIESELQGRDWIVPRARPTIADVALYSYIARAPEGNVDLAGYPAVRAWLGRVEALPGFQPFRKTAVGLEMAS